MKNYLFPFLFLFSIVICGQNAANKVERYRIDPELAYPFKKPLLGKVKKVHTAHYSTDVTTLNNTIKKKYFKENYTYSFDERENEIEFIIYDMYGNISSKCEKRYNEKDSLTYLREFTWVEEYGTYIDEKSYSYNTLGLLQEVKGYILEGGVGLSLNRELYKYNDKQQLLERHYYNNDTLIETTIRSYNDRGKLIKELYYFKEKLYSEYKLEYDERDNLIKEYYTQIPANKKNIITYQYDDQNRLILAIESTNGDENILIKNIYKNNLLIESYDDKNGYEKHILYHYKDNQLIEEEKSTGFFNGCYYSTTKKKIQYDERGRVKRYYDYEREEIVRTYIHHYDNKDRVIKTELLYTGDKKEYWIDSYDTAGNLIETIYKNDDYRDKDNYTYDNNNNLLSKTTYKDNKIVEKTTYNYDKYQNITKIEKYNNETIYIYERTFTYYE